MLFMFRICFMNSKVSYFPTNKEIIFLRRCLRRVCQADLRRSTERTLAISSRSENGFSR